MAARILTPPPGVKVYDFYLGPIWFDRGIIVTANNGLVSHGLDEAKASIAKVREVSKGVAMPLLVDFSKVKHMSREAREYYNSIECKGSASAMAILTTSSIGRLIANFFLGMKKPPIPIRLFEDFEEAMTWLLKQTESERSIIQEETHQAI